MTVLQRIVRALKPRTQTDLEFESYYSRLLRSGSVGVPSAREAQQDLWRMRVQDMTAHRYL